MSIVKPVSDLRDYNKVLRDVGGDNSVILTKNGHGKYIVLDLEEHNKDKAQMKLLGELLKGERSARDEGWVSEDEMRIALGL